MIVKEIIEKYLRENGYDGLFHDGDCGCEVDDLIPCEVFCNNCEPGYKVSCNPETCELGGDCRWHISPDKETK